MRKGSGSEGMDPENALVGVGVLVAAEYFASEVAAELVHVVAAGVAGTEVFGLDACGADRGVGVGDELGLEDNLGLVEGLLGLQPLGCGFEGFLIVVQGGGGAPDYGLELVEEAVGPAYFPEGAVGAGFLV